MPLYDYRCPDGHVFEAMATIADRDHQDCPACGRPSGKVLSPVSLGGRAGPGPSMDQMPQTWRGTYEGNPEYVSQLRRRWEARQKLEEKYEELRGDRRPVLAHEGRYHKAPLRAGDPLPGAHQQGTHDPLPGGHQQDAHGQGAHGQGAHGPELRVHATPAVTVIVCDFCFFNSGNRTQTGRSVRSPSAADRAGRHAPPRTRRSAAAAVPPTAAAARNEMWTAAAALPRL
ncbi:MAG TPA: zinc ribbon domain-containing protein [Streptosporangiaceae bacterium]|nr:zinc ribbon domain-containing protein [Streptosporangiaceae bacterium]